MGRVVLWPSRKEREPCLNLSCDIELRSPLSELCWSLRAGAEKGGARGGLVIFYRYFLSTRSPGQGEWLFTQRQAGCHCFQSIEPYILWNCGFTFHRSQPRSTDRHNHDPQTVHRIKDLRKSFCKRTPFSEKEKSVTLNVIQLWKLESVNRVHIRAGRELLRNFVIQLILSVLLLGWP